MDELKQNSNNEINQFNENLKNKIYNRHCPHSYYNYTGFDSYKAENLCIKYKNECQNKNYLNVDSNASSCLKCLKELKGLNNEETNEINEISTRYNNNFEILKVCQNINLVEKYFVGLNSFKLATNISNLTENYKNNECDQFLLDPNRYSNIDDNYNLHVNKDLICLEGNIIYVDKNCKVGSGNINTCLFSVVELNNTNSIVCHMNGTLSNKSVYGNYINENVKYIFSNDNCLQFIKEWINKLKQTVKKIYLTGILDLYYFNDNCTGFSFSNNNNILNMDDNDIIE